MGHSHYESLSSTRSNSLIRDALARSIYRSPGSSDTILHRDFWYAAVSCLSQSSCQAGIGFRLERSWRTNRLMDLLLLVSSCLSSDFDQHGLSSEREYRDKRANLDAPWGYV